MNIQQLFAFIALLLAPAEQTTRSHSYTFDEVRSNDPAPIIEVSTGLTAEQESRIIGGVDASISDFPYVASVRIDGITVCAATLIAPQYLLTTAHCVRTDEITMTASFDTIYRFGNDGEEVAIDTGFKHPLYNKKMHKYDVGLLKLMEPRKQKIASLPAADGSDEKVGTMAIILGWGQTATEDSSFKLQSASIPIISHEECNKFESYKDQLSDGMLCAGDGNGKGSCRGDSGGPLIANDVLVGFVSWAGEHCGKEPGVYTRISSVLDYIQSVLDGDEDENALRVKPASSAEQTF